MEVRGIYKTNEQIITSRKAATTQVRTLTFNDQEAIAVLKDQYVVGTVTAKIISPRPNFY